MGFHLQSPRPHLLRSERLRRCAMKDRKDLNMGPKVKSENLHAVWLWVRCTGWVDQLRCQSNAFFERIPFLGSFYTKNEKRFPRKVLWGDIVRGLPHKKESVQGIFCSHILEHLSLEDCRKAIRKTHEYLIPGGTFRLVVPDLEYAIQQYLKDPTPEAAAHFMRNTMLGAVSRGNFIRRIMEGVFGNSKHQWMWDEKALTEELKNAGFQKIRRALIGDSEDKRFVEVEKPERFLNCLAIQARK